MIRDRNIFKVNAASKKKKPEVKSRKETIVILEDVTECLTSEKLTETVNDRQRFCLIIIQFALLSRKIKASVQSHRLYQMNPLSSLSNNNTILI